MRMGYQRLPGFGATRASIKAGEKYEIKVGRELQALPELQRGSWSLATQLARNGGRVDFALYPMDKSTLFLIEVKSQFSLDAYNQLLHYAGEDKPYLARVCICKVHHPHVPIPEAYECLPLGQLLQSKIGGMTIIPWNPRP